MADHLKQMSIAQLLSLLNKTELAQSIGISEVYAYKLADGSREPSRAVAAAIALATGTEAKIVGDRFVFEMPVDWTPTILAAKVAAQERVGGPERLLHGKPIEKEAEIVPGASLEAKT